MLHLVRWSTGTLALFCISTLFSAGAGAQTVSIARTPDGHPDLSGLWDHPFAVNMAVTMKGDKCGAEMSGCKQIAPEGGLPMTPLGEEMFRKYDAAKFDATGHCNPMGATRSMNAPVPTQIVQSPHEIVFLHESMFAFHVVYMDGRKHPTKEEALETTWYGHSTGKWDGDTLVVDTAGPFFGSPRMILDTAGHPMSEDLHLVERFTRLDANHLSYEVTVDDPKYYSKPWKNTRVWTLMKPTDEILEYVCTENNKDLGEGLIK
jgi:hypothetical protein